MVAVFLHSSGNVNSRHTLYHERGLTMQTIGARQRALRVSWQGCQILHRPHILCSRSLGTFTLFVRYFLPDLKGFDRRAFHGTVVEEEILSLIHI